MEEIITGLEIDEALNRLLDVTGSKLDEGYEEISILDSCGRVLYEDIYSEIDVPSVPKSAMDGYALRVADIKVLMEKCTAEDEQIELRVAGELCAGDYQEYSVRPGICVRVMTGAYVPKDFDAVIKQEDVEAIDGGISISLKTAKAIYEYMNYCKAGEDIQKGSCVLKSGTLLSTVHIGVLASLGRAYVKVKRPVRVALISTGSEIVAPGFECKPGKIYNNSAYMLHAMIKNAGMKIPLMTIIPDEENLLCSALENAAKSVDIIITTGAVSVGKKDIVPAVLDRIGARILFRRANIQPGTPTIGSLYKNTVILSLSGNPYAAVANFELYFWPVVSKLMGCKELDVTIGNATMACAYTKSNQHVRLLRAYVKDGVVTLPEKVHSSSVISNLSQCNCFIELEAGRTLEKGDRVKIRYARFR